LSPLFLNGLVRRRFFHGKEISVWLAIGVENMTKSVDQFSHARLVQDAEQARGSVNVLLIQKLMVSP